jgi:hypothetical protein
MRSTRLAEAEDCEDDDIKGTAAAKEGEKQNDQGEEKKDEPRRSSPRGGAYRVATRQLTSQATRGDGLEAEVKRR